MKVYAMPDSIPELKVDYSNFDRDKYFRDEEAHKLTVKQHLIQLGYTGKNTGRVLRMPAADGYAQYMMAEGSKSCLIHLPYMDGYHARGVEGLTKKWVLEEIDRGERLAALFAAKGA